MFRNIHAILVFIVLASISVFAYGQDAQVQGQVLDTSGAGISKALVRVVDQQTSTERKIETNNNGQYTVTGLAPGAYKIVVEAPGFSTAASEQITLNPGQQAILDFTLKVGATSADIIVTATRRSESVEKVPISIRAISQDDLVESGIKDITDIAAVTPGLQFAAPGYPSTITTITIRGLNTNTGASVVGLYLDDTPLQARLSPVGNFGSPYPMVFDLNRVEVARGPQGTLFGAGSEAGTVRFITNQPSLSEFSGFSHAEVATTQGGDPSYEVGAAAGGPIIHDKVGYRVSVWDRHDGGYVNMIDPTGNVTSHNTNYDDELAIKTALAFELNKDIVVTPSVFFQNLHSGDSGRFYANFSNPSTGYYVNGHLLPDVSTDRFTVPTVKVEAHLPFAELTANVSYIDRRVSLSLDTSALWGAIGVVNYGSPLGPGFVTSPSDVAPTITGQTIRGFTEEVRLVSNQRDAFFTWVAGIFHDHRTQVDYDTIWSSTIDPTGAAVYYAFQRIPDEQTAVFAQGDLHLTSKWTATLGGREAYVKSSQLNLNGTGVLDAGEPPTAYEEVQNTPFTPKAALSYQAGSNNSFYISASEGFRVGGGNESIPSFCNATIPSSYKPDFAWSYEAGAKDTLLGERLQIDSSVFHVGWSKIQQMQYVGSCGYGYTTNAGNAVSNGFDSALQALFTRRLRMNLDVGYVNAYFTDNMFDSTGQPLVLKGYKIGFLPQVNPPWDVNMSTNYGIPLGDGTKAFLRGEYQYHSRNPGPFVNQITTSPNYLPLMHSDPPTHLFNIRAGVTKNKLDVTLFVQNVLNSHPLLNTFQYAAASDLTTNTTFRPRTVGVTANLSF